MASIFSLTSGTGPNLEPQDLPQEEFCACGALLVTDTELETGRCQECGELLIPVCSSLTVESLLAAIEADRQRMAEACQKVKEEALLAPAVVTVYRRQEERLRAARDVIRFYLQASEEAATFDADAPLPIEVTPAGRALCAAGCL